jgi:hypothetical protein
MTKCAWVGEVEEIFGANAMNTSLRHIFSMGTAFVLVTAQHAAAHSGHSHEGVPGGESHVALVMAGGVTVALAIAAIAYHWGSRQR